MNLKTSVMSGLRWTAGARFSAQLITWAITITIIRLLSPEDYGLMSLATVFVSFLAMLNELGLGASIVQRKDLEEKAFRPLFGLILILSIFFYLVIFFSAPLVAGFYDEQRLVALLRFLALQFLLMPFIVLPQSFLLRKMAFRSIAVVDFSSAIAGSLVTLTLALMGHGVWSLVWGTLAIRVTSIIGLYWAHPLKLAPSFKMAGVFAFFTFGGYVTLSRILWFFYTCVDVLIIGKMLGQELLGFYSIGVYLATLPMEKVSGIINQVAFPAFSSVQEKPGLAGQHFLKAVRVMSFIAFPVLWGVSCLAPEVVAVFLGDKWLQSALPLQIVALIIPVRMVSNLMNPAVLGAGRADVSFHNSLVAFLVMPVSFFVGSFWGLLGVSLTWVIAFPFVFIFNLSRVVKILEIRLLEVLLSMKLPFLTGLFMFLGVQAVKSSPVITIQLVPRMFVMIIAGAIIYFCMTLLFNRRGMKEVIELVRS